MLYNLQVVRIFAIYLVVLFHFQGLTAAAGLTPLRYGGVDILLIFTGFLAVKVTAMREVNPARFFMERLVRIAPLYWLITFVVFALSLIAPHFFQATRADAFELAKSLFFIPFVKSNGLIQPLVYVGWTLNYQVVFYALFAIGLFARPRMLGVAFACLVLIGLAAAGGLFNLHGVDQRFYTSPIILDFVLGMVIASLFTSLPSATPDRLKAGLSALVAAGALCVYFWGGLGGEHAPRVLAKGVPGALFLIGMLGLERYGVTFKSAAINFWAKATYSIFLTHIFVIGVTQHIARDLTLEGAAALWTLMVGLVAITIVGCLTYQYVEKPITNLARGMMFGRRAQQMPADEYVPRLRTRP